MLTEVTAQWWKTIAGGAHVIAWITFVYVTTSDLFDETTTVKIQYRVPIITIILSETN